MEIPIWIHQTDYHILAAVVRDTLYIDGGYLFWLPGLSDGNYGDPVSDGEGKNPIFSVQVLTVLQGNPLGLVYTLNFSMPFSTSENISNAFNTTSKAEGGSGDVNNIAPQFTDGVMFANDYEWFTYGGLLQQTDAYTPPLADAVVAYEVYNGGPPRQFAASFILEYLPDNMTRYVTSGAGVSAPSENMGYYFAGLRAADWGPIYDAPGNETVNADVESLTLIQLNMTVQQHEVWNNHTLPPSVQGRANADLVWIPVSTHGVLIAIGGVIDPVFANVNQSLSASQTAASVSLSSLLYSPS